MGRGLTDLCGDRREQDKSIAGENDFGWRSGHADMAFNACLYQVHTPRRGEKELQGIQFRMMANRGFVMLNRLIPGNYEIPAWWVELNHAYEQALPHMKVRRLLPGGANAEELLGAAVRATGRAGTLSAKAGRVYKITPAT